MPKTKGDKNMKTKSLMGTVVLFALALAACAPQPAASNNPAPTTAVQKVEPTATKVSPTETNIPIETPTEMPTPAVTDTPVALSINMIAVDNQWHQSGNVLISLVTAEKPGWVVVFTDNNGQPGNVLGYAPVPAGTSSDVEVPVNPKQTTSKMMAALLVDAGTIGKFEYPSPDTFATEAGSDVMMVFNRSTG